MLVRHCFIDPRLLVGDATRANVGIELGIHLQPLADNQWGLGVCGDVGQPVQVTAKVSTAEQGLLSVGCGVYPGSIGFGKAVLFTSDGVGAGVEFAMVRGTEGLVAHSVFHVIVIPSSAPCAKEVDFVASASVLICRQGAIEGTRVEINGLACANLDALDAGLKGIGCGSRVGLDGVELVLWAGVDDCDEWVIGTPVRNTLISRIRPGKDEAREAVQSSEKKLRLHDEGFC